VFWRLFELLTKFCELGVLFVRKVSELLDFFNRVWNFIISLARLSLFLLYFPFRFIRCNI
jgi:hypothetical protein